MKKILSYFIIAGFLLISSCEILDDDDDNIFRTESWPSYSVPFEQVPIKASLEFSAQGIINNEYEWCEFWDALYATSTQKPECDRNLIDFENELAIYVALGPRPNSCYSVNITRIIRKGNRLEIDYDEIVPGYGCFCAHIIVFPIDIVKIDKDDYTGIKDVEFQHHIKEYDCM